MIIASLGRLITVLTSMHALDSGNECKSNSKFTRSSSSFANLRIDLAVPLAYWTTAEPVVSILGVCLPAMLPLGRYLASNHLNPLASKISAIFRTRSCHEGAEELHTGNGRRMEDDTEGSSYNLIGSSVTLQHSPNPRDIV